MNEAKEEKTFEERLQSVQDTITLIENGKLSLEDSVREYERGIQILNGLDAELKEINRKLTVLQESPDGIEEKPLKEEV